MTTHMTRRNLLVTLGTAAGAALGAAPAAFAQGRQGAPSSAPTVISNPPRDFGPGAPPTTYFNDPDVLTIDPSFNALVQPNTSLVRLWTGALWPEGPAWSAQGRYLVCTAIPTNLH